VTFLAQAAAQLIDFGFTLHIAALEWDERTSVFGVISLLAQGAVGFAAALRSARSSRRRLWQLLSALVAVLLVVRIAVGYHAALLVGPVALVFVLVWRLSADEPASVRATARGGLLLLVCSFVVHAIGIKVVSGLGYGQNTWPYEVKAVLKHGTELSGWVLLATSIAAGWSAAAPTSAAGMTSTSPTRHRAVRTSSSGDVYVP
jgi:hypothetical protein